ncbi:MAG: type IV pilus twitching motility protein PilT [bacterium]|nr:type IV pilus twitching motility protein PilT [bacterium]
MNIEDLLRLLYERNASDLHLTVGIPPTLRVYGRLVRTEFPRLTPEDTKALAYSLMNPEQRAKFEQSREIDFSYGLPGVGRFRINIFYQRGSIGIAIRSIPYKIPKLEELGLPPVLKELTKKPKGLILVTGPTGSGKSTTLASMIDVINENRDCHIVTIEDPIEYVHTHKKGIVNQREVGSDTLSFVNALRAVLREDPDVILIGEMRDLETIQAAITAAETGHLVLATLHTNNASQTVERIIDVFPPHQQEQIKLQLSNTIEAIISQRLLPRRKEKILGDGMLRGRVVAVEILIATPAVRNLIREGKVHMIPNVIQTGSQFGMVSMDQSLLTLYRNGEITLEDFLYNVTNRDEMLKIIGESAKV